MKLLIYTKQYDLPDAFHDFMDFYHSINMKYLASDLLDKGLTPKQIADAVAMAIKVARSSGIKAHEHFMPVFSSIGPGIIQDCKLSPLGYGLVLINADISIPAVGGFQISLLEALL
jgi:hypothetical protein